MLKVERIVLMDKLSNSVAVTLLLLLRRWVDFVVVKRTINAVRFFDLALMRTISRAPFSVPLSEPSKNQFISGFIIVNSFELELKFLQRRPRRLG